MGVFPSPFLTTVFWPSHPPLSTLDFQPSGHKPNYLFLLLKNNDPVKIWSKSDHWFKSYDQKVYLYSFVLQFRNSDSDIIEIQMKFRTRLVRNRSGQTMWRWKDLFKRMKFALLKLFKKSLI